MARVVHFEIHADEPERAIEFYKSALGWEFTKWDGAGEYWLIITGSPDEPGINGGLIKRLLPMIQARVLIPSLRSLHPTCQDPSQV